MKTIKLCIAIFAITCIVPLSAQTADEILDTYFENIGGLEKLKSVEGIKMVAKMNQQGMEIPLEIFQLSDGRQYTSINFQGKKSNRVFSMVKHYGVIIS